MDFRAAQNNPAVTTYAPLEMRVASDALAEANLAAQEQRGTQSIDALAYLAKQKIALAQEVAKQKYAETSVVTAGAERDQIRLAQRTVEADEANLRANSAKQAASAAQEQTTQAQMATAQAERQAQEAKQHAAQLQSQLQELAAKTTERGIVITIGDVLFATDRASLNPEGMRNAQKLSVLLQENPQRTVLVEGYTDSVGSAAYNQGLSERRAAAVSKALQELGVASARISTRGYGETHPVASNDNGKVAQR
ncbi:MAG: OmpA family protein [Burkholderiales bacterium]|nr:OmpA family protein [Burkholderiales bacterium]